MSAEQPLPARYSLGNRPPVSCLPGRWAACVVSGGGWHSAQRSVDVPAPGLANTSLSFCELLMQSKKIFLYTRDAEMQKQSTGPLLPRKTERVCFCLCQAPPLAFESEVRPLWAEQSCQRVVHETSRPHCDRESAESQRVPSVWARRSPTRIERP